MSAGTTIDQARENMLLAQTILDSSGLSYGTYKVPGHGVVTLDRKKGLRFIGNKLAHMRKPSAYKGKVSGVCIINAGIIIINIIALYIKMFHMLIGLTTEYTISSL